VAVTEHSQRLAGARGVSSVEPVVAVSDRRGQSAATRNKVPDACSTREFYDAAKFLFGSGFGGVMGGGDQEPVRQSQFDDRAQRQ
jgi:hypothetical protein